MGIFLTPRLVFLIGVECFGVVNEVAAHGVADRIGESCLLTHEDLIGDELVLVKSMAQQVFAYAVSVQLLFGVDGHAVGQKVQVSEGHAGLQ